MLGIIHACITLRYKLLPCDLQAGFYSDTVEFWISTLEILVRSSAGEKGDGHIFHLLDWDGATTSWILLYKSVLRSLKDLIKNRVSSSTTKSAHSPSKRYEPHHEKTIFAYADQLRSDCDADQHLCFPYMDSIILLSKSKFQASSILL